MPSAPWIPPLPAVARVTRDLIKVSGPDTIGFLQGQLSQDVAALEVGRTAWSFVLQPQGKVDAWVRVHRTGDAEIAIDVECGCGPALLTRLQRFKLRTDCDLALDEAVPTVSVRGTTLARGLSSGWPSVGGSDLIGADAIPRDLPAGTAELDDDGFDVVRIACGVPAMGREMTDATIPAEVGQWVIDASVSFTKGCFTGQELVARIDSRGGNVPRRLRGFIAGTPAPSTGAPLVVDGATVGAVTSSATASDGTVVGLAYVKRGVDVPVTATVAAAEGAATTVELRPLPLFLLQ